MNASCAAVHLTSDMWEDADVVCDEDSASNNDLRPRPGPSKEKTDSNSIFSGYMFLAGAAAVAATAIIVVKRLE